MPIDFHKYHALGNVYLVIDPNKTRLNLSGDTIKLMCDWHYGIGSDGILYGPLFEDGEIQLRIFNPDGSAAEKSGNGIRIFSRYLFETGYVAASPFTLSTPGGKVRVEILDDQASRIKVDMGTVNFHSVRIPAAGEPRDIVDEVLPVGAESLRVSCVSIGNPHCVVRVDDVSRETALRLGPLVENHVMFPRRINVQFLKVIDRRNIRIEIWERGAGYTLASGSSSCAAASAAYRLGLVDRQVQVHMPGGVLDIDIQPDEHICMTGPVTHIASGEFSAEMRQRIGSG